MRFLLLATVGLLLLSAATALAGPIRLIRSKLVDNDGPEPYVLVNIVSGMDSADTDALSLWIRKPTGGYGKLFVENKMRTIAALNIRPATKDELVYLLLSPRGSSTTVISDFNARLSRLCVSHSKEINDTEISVKRIDGDVLSVWSRSYGKAVYSLRIRVLPSGSLRLLQYEKVAE